MRVHILALDGHLRTMPQHPFDHRRHLGRRAALELRIDTGGVLLNMPVDHDASPMVTDTPFGHQVLVPCPNLFRVGGTGGGSLAPNLREASMKDGIHDVCNGRTDM